MLIGGDGYVINSGSGDQDVDILENATQFNIGMSFVRSRTLHRQAKAVLSAIGA